MEPFTRQDPDRCVGTAKFGNVAQGRRSLQHRNLPSAGGCLDEAGSFIQTLMDVRTVITVPLFLHNGS